MKDSCEMIKGNSIDFQLMQGDCEIKANITVAKDSSCIRVWGRVLDCNGRGVADALLKLVQPVYIRGKIDFEGVAHTRTDCEGFYQFDICGCKPDGVYKIIASRMATGRERTVESDNCNPCKGASCETRVVRSCD